MSKSVNPFAGVSSGDLTVIENVAQVCGLSKLEFMQRLAVSVSKEYYIARHFLTTEVTVDLRDICTSHACFGRKRSQ